MNSTSVVRRQQEKTRRILIVDDDEDTLELLTLGLPSSYHISTAKNGREALELMLGNCIPDLLLTDLCMPTMTGLDLIQVIRSTPSMQHIPVVVMTGMPRQETLERCFEFGAVDHLAKPFNLMELRVRVDTRLKSVDQLAKLERLNGRLRRKVSKGEKLQEMLLDTVELEKLRVGLGLHEGICQNLAGIKLFIEANSSNQAVPGEQIEKLLQETIGQTRAMANEICPVQLFSGGFSHALMHLADNSETLFQISCRCEFEDREWKPPRGIAMHLYRIIYDTLYYAKQHGNAQNAAIIVTKKENAVLLNVENDGVPFLKKREFISWGLQIIRTRANLIGVDVQFADGDSTAMYCAFPLLNGAKKRTNSLTH
jgi:CheY-like chemotaxis protein